MLNILREIKMLREEGKLHRKLIRSTRILLIISFILAVVVLFNVIFRAANPFIVLGLAVGGFILGVLVFSKMNVMNWNEEDATVQTMRMDTVGYIVLGLYIAFEIGLRTFLTNYFPISATTFLLAAIFGTLFGRTVGTLIEIHRVYQASHGAQLEK